MTFVQPAKQNLTVSWVVAKTSNFTAFHVKWNTSHRDVEAT